jgi:hypothetical protein
MAQLHASIGAGPTLHSHRSPSRLAGPGPTPGLIPSPSQVLVQGRCGVPVVVLVSPHPAAPDLVAAHCLRYWPGGPRPGLTQLGKSVIPTTRTTSWRAGSRDHARLESPVLAGAGATRSPARRAGLSAGLSAGPTAAGVPRGTRADHPQRTRHYSAPMSAPSARARRSAAGWSSRIWNPPRCGLAVASHPIALVIASSSLLATAH